jgi:hypothetical protein
VVEYRELSQRCGAKEVHCPASLLKQIFEIDCEILPTVSPDLEFTPEKRLGEMTV